ncbi:MAG: phenylalanine--tRNA ligase subunit beta [Candidatus Omnitrophica bacterium]|nr:phenylalanine--tRNA ligase subunit beta [Candidatus Omnitrophota bacterium]MDD5660800.1 phenylalanine--tRNA ligase subunit beta [Candidatus Omnitrophota bacterium]
MKITYNWLKDFIDLKVPPFELAEKLTMAGLEVVSLKESGGDFIFEIEITSNRPDWLSIEGIAREVSAICGGTLKTKTPKELKFKNKGILSVPLLVSNKKDCPFYSGRVICGVKVGPSPGWLKKRLELLGCRSVNNIVDITNYILFELGQPLHAFDLDKIEGPQICVRRAMANEKIITIDGKEQLLDPEILVIADKNKPVAIAGIMGGREAEVAIGTRNILLESAVFNPVLLRRGRQKLGLQSESVYRFERGVSLSGAARASFIASDLILSLASGNPCGYKSLGSLKTADRLINLDPAYVKRVLGGAIPAVKMKQILNKLGLVVKVKAKQILSVKVPDFRQDLKLPVDLVEEIARIYGYEKIAQSTPAVVPQEKLLSKRDITCAIKNLLSGLGLHEVITYSLIDRALLAKTGIKTDSEVVEILNPLSCEQEVLRPSLLPSLIRCVAFNLNQQIDYVNIFEIANVFLARPHSVEEEPVLAIALCGVHSFLSKQGLVKDDINILHLKGILEALFNKLKVKDFNFTPQDDGKISILLGQKQAGFMLELSRQALDSVDIKNRQVVLAEVNLKQLFGCIGFEKKFASLPKYPAITRDISFVIKQDIAVRDLLIAIEEKGAPLLRSAKIADYYQGKQIPAGFIGLTVSCVYRLDERTLTEEEVNPLHNTVCSLLEERFGIKLR